MKNAAEKMTYLLGGLESGWIIDVYVRTAEATLPPTHRIEETTCLTFFRRGALTINTSGFSGVFSDATLNVPWNAVYFMRRSDGTHLIDWANMPHSVFDQDALDAYQTNVRAAWHGYISIGKSPVAPVPMATPKLPRGWRVIQGGRAHG